MKITLIVSACIRFPRIRLSRVRLSQVRLSIGSTCARVLFAFLFMTLCACQGTSIPDNTPPIDNRPPTVCRDDLQFNASTDSQNSPSEYSTQDGFIHQLSNGDVLVENTVFINTHTSYIFVKINDKLIRKETISVVDNQDGSFTHSLVIPQKDLTHGDNISARFVFIESYDAAQYEPADTHLFTTFVPELPPKVEGEPFIIPWSEVLHYSSPQEAIAISTHDLFTDNYIAQHNDGSVIVCHRTTFETPTSQLFFRKNGIQGISTPAVTAHIDGSYSHAFRIPADELKDGDSIEARFYVVDNGIGVFIPGATHETWTPSVVYRAHYSEGIVDAGDTSIPAGQALSPPQNTGAITPLFNAQTLLEPATVYDRGDAIITRFSDRARDRHAREDDPDFQKYDHYLTHYWEHRTARYEFADYVSKGQSRIDIKIISEWTLNAKEFRAFYSGEGGTNSYHDNAGAHTTIGPVGRYDDEFNFIDDNGNQRLYTLTMTNYYPLRLDSSIPRQEGVPLEVGQYMEFESSLFIDQPPIGRDNYYATTFLYRIGDGGLVPWETRGEFNHDSPDVFTPADGERENSYPIDPTGWLGGQTTLPYNYSGEPDNHFMQMATNLSHLNGQAFVRGRRILHTDFITGQHDENPENGIFDELKNLTGPHYINSSCSSCHTRNGRALVADNNIALTKWVFKVGGPDGKADPRFGNILQPNSVGIPFQEGEGRVAIASWEETNDGLRQPRYLFEKGTPAYVSARIAPQLVGLGLLEAIDENDILEREDFNDENNDGISGKANKVIDPVTGQLRLGRFGWKAGAGSLKQQIAAALNSDMGVMTSVYPNPDCGSEQLHCQNIQLPQLADHHLDDLVKYTALLGVRARRDLDNDDALAGEIIFHNVGCEACHRSTFTTSPYHPFAELRSQTIHPYSDLLLHDMGPGLADNLSEGNANGAEWRTTPLWGLGLAEDVSEGTGDEYQSGNGYLHDGRARTIEEAILWHGGEAEESKNQFEMLTSEEKQQLLLFLNSL